MTISHPSSTGSTDSDASSASSFGRITSSSYSWEHIGGNRKTVETSLYPTPGNHHLSSSYSFHCLLHTTNVEMKSSANFTFTSLLSLLKSNVVTPNEFLARAEQLLEPAQFKILDVIRRRHVPPQPQQQQQLSTPASAASTPATNSPIATANTSAVSSPMHQHRPVATGIVRPAGTQFVSTPAVPTPAQPVTPQSTAVAPATPAPQSAPVRKRNIDTGSVATPPNERYTRYFLIKVTLMRYCDTE